MRAADPTLGSHFGNNRYARPSPRCGRQIRGGGIPRLHASTAGGDCSTSRAEECSTNAAARAASRRNFLAGEGCGGDPPVCMPCDAADASMPGMPTCPPSSITQQCTASPPSTGTLSTAVAVVGEPPAASAAPAAPPKPVVPGEVVGKGVPPPGACNRGTVAARDPAINRWVHPGRSRCCSSECSY